MADSPDVNPEEFMQWFPDSSSLLTEPRNHDLISTTNAAVFTSDFSELEAQIDDDPEVFSQWCQFPDDQMDFSSQVATNHRADHLQISNQQPHSKIVSGHRMRQHEPRLILPKSGTGSAQSLLHNQHTTLVDEAWNGCDYTQYPARTASLPENSAADASWNPLSSELGTMKQQDPEQVVTLKKRHLDIEDGKPYLPGLENNKRQKTAAAYDYPNKDQVGTIEASFFEDWLSKFPDVFPGPEQFASLAGLTQIRTETVQSWFSKRLRNGPQPITFANLPVKPYAVTEAPNPGTPKMTFTQQPSNQPVQQPPNRTLIKVKLEASNWVREHKAKKCRKRRNPVNFIRDPEKRYCCTLGCGTKFKGKDDWRKHEEKNYPQRGWICDVGSTVQLDGRTLCAFCGIPNPKTEHDHRKALCSEKKVEARGRLHFRKEHFRQHFINVHPGIAWNKYLENNHFKVKKKFPRRCGFCQYIFNHWRDRIEHIAGHFIAGKDMSQWDFGVEDDEVDQIKSSDHENSDGDGDFDRKRYKTPDDESDCSDDDSNDSTSKPAPKQRRRNTQHIYAHKACSLIKSRDVSVAKDFRRTTHTHQETHSVPLEDSFPDLYLPNLVSENISYKPLSITAIIIPSAPNNKTVSPFGTKSVLKRKRPLLSDKYRLFTAMVEVKAVERSKIHRMSHFLRTCENPAYLHLQTNFLTPNGLACLIQSYAGTLIPSVEAITRWCKLLTSGNVNSDTQIAITVTKYAPKISENLSARWGADVSSLASLLLGMWRLLVDENKATFKSLLTGLFSSSALYHENFAQFQEWISLPRNNGHVRRTRVARKALRKCDTILAMQQKDAPVAFDFSLYSCIHLQSIEKPLMSVVEDQHNASPISFDTTSELPLALCMQSASGIQDTSGAPRSHAPISQSDFHIPIMKSITRGAGNIVAVSAQKVVPDHTIHEQMPDCSLSFTPNDLSSSLAAAKAREPSTGVQFELCDSGIGSSLDLSWNSLRNSFPETNFYYNNSSNAKSLYPASNINYSPEDESLAGLLSTETWLQNTAPWDAPFATPKTALDSTSTNFSNVDDYDLSSISGIQEPWPLTNKDLGSITPLLLSPDLTLDSTESSHMSLSSNNYKSFKIWDYSTHNRTKGRRTQPLSVASRKSAALVRKVRACLPCYVQKRRCDTGNACAQCTKQAAMPYHLSSTICIRGRISDYSHSLLPDLITSKYSKKAIQVAVSRQIAGFTNNRIEVLMSTGSTYPPIPITVYEFIPLSRQLLQPHHPSLVELDNIPLQNTYLDTPPLALWNYDPAEVKDKLSRHVKAIIKVPPEIGEAVSDETWMVSCKTFEAVNKYLRASDIREEDRILELALELHAMHYVMSHLIIIEPSSASQAFTKLQRPQFLPYDKKILSPNLINLQLKCEMIVLLRETTTQVLRGLERMLVAIRCNYATWYTAFCLILVVCSCIERVEIAVDATIVMKMQKVEMTTANTLPVKHCLELEQVFFSHVKLLFRCAYKSHENQRQGGFNPIRDGLEPNEEEGITLPMVKLVQDIRRIIEEHRDEINDRAKDLQFETEPAKLLEDHWRLRKPFLGRMVAKFLMEFFH